MHTVTQILIEHGYLAIFLVVLAEQLGLPVPASPFLIAAGALASEGKLSLTWAVAIAMSASILSDYGWFQLGKKRGNSILRWFGQKSAGRQSSAAKLQAVYLRYGPQSILISKFVPLFNIVAPQAAGTFRLASWKFLTLDTTAVLLWTSAYMALGWMFSSRLDSIATFIHRAGGFLGTVVAVAIAIAVVQRVCSACARPLRFIHVKHSV